MQRFIILAALASNIYAAAPAADLIPLEMGNYWTYREEMTGATFTIRVGQPVWLQSGALYHYLIGYAGASAIARVDESGNLMALDEDTGDEKLLAAFAEREGRWWQAPRRECLQEGQTLDKRAAYDGPAGRWQRVLEVRYRSTGCADAGVVSEQFAENVGMLRRVVQTIAGPRTYDLVYARVGSTIIETTDRARFSIAVDQSQGLNDFRVTLRVDLGYVPEIRLRFPNAQVFDVALRDAAGKVVWTWSEGRFFEQSEQIKSIGNVWTETVLMPRPPGNLEGYTIAGWLTTAPDEAKFAATAPMPPPRIQPAR